MKCKSLIRSFTLLAAVALAVPVFAKLVMKTVNIPQTAKVGKAQLQAGEYTLQIDGSTITVKRGKKVLAEAAGRWEERENKQPYDSVVLGPDGIVQEFRFGGDRRVLVLAE